MKIPDSVINEILDKADIAGILGRFLQLKRVGSRYTACCPFHEEKLPSFSVDPDKKFWYCFGCKEGGNVFGFLMKHEGMGFVEAVKKVAEEVGVEIRLEETSSADNAKKRGYELLSCVCEYYARILFGSPEGQPGRDYLSRRSIDPVTAKKFKLGFSPKNDIRFWNMLKKSGFTEAEAVKCGAAVFTAKGRCRELLSGRLIFPICDFQGRVVAMGGRRLDDSDPGTPKYINSPETPWYSKRFHLYGLNNARGKISKENTALIVEGYLDVISMHQVGIGYCAASLGTALTKEQAALLKRYTKRVTLAYDGDNAGANAVIKGSAVLEDEGMQVTAVIFPDGEDPDSLAHKGIEAVKKVLDNKIGTAAFQIQRSAKKNNLLVPEGKENFINEVMPVISKIKDPVRRDAYLRELEYYTGGYSINALQRELLKSRAASEESRQAPAPQRYSRPVSWINLSSEERLLNLCASNPGWIDNVKNIVALDMIEDKELLSIFEKIFRMDGRTEPVKINELVFGGSFSQINTRIAGILAVCSPESAIDDAEKTALEIRDNFFRKRLAFFKTKVFQALKSGKSPEEIPEFSEYQRLMSYFK